MKKVLQVLFLISLGLTLTGCGFTPNDFGKFWNVMIAVIGIIAGLGLLYFVVIGIITVFYKGKDVDAKVLKKKEAKVLRGNMMGKTSAGYRGQTDTTRKARREKGRIRFSKVTVEIDGKKKMLKCNDIVLLDKLIIGRVNRIRIRFGEIIKILK